MRYMSDYYNPNENPHEKENGSAESGPAGGQHVWNVPPQNEGQGYRPPYERGAAGTEESGRQEPPQDLTPNQYSASGGWQRPDGRSAQRRDAYQWNISDYEQAAKAKPRRRNKGLMVFGIILASVLVVSLVSLTSIGIYSSMRKDAGAPPASDNGPTLNVPADDLPGITLQDKPQSAGESLPGGKLSSEEIIEKVSPSVVAITTYVNYQNYQAEGMGSGIIIREDGYIVTNAHVVEGAKGITVQLGDGTSYEGRLVGSDSKTDLAVVKVDAENLPAATFGNSDQVKMGEKVLAIGNPQSMDFAGSVTQGIVSGLNRQITAGGQNGTTVTHYTNLIQTDAAINPGNSGGALVNEYGQVIGINSAKVIATGAEGMGFAIPSNEVKPIVDDLIAYGRVTGRVRLGIYATEVDEVLARLNHVPTGLFVQSTEEGSDISKKGVVPGDIITKVNGKDITGTQDLSAEIEGKKPGDTVELEVYRPSQRPNAEGKFFTVTVALMEDLGDSVSTQGGVQDPSDAYGQNPYGNGQNPYGNDYDDYGDSYDEFEDFFNQFFG